MAAEPISMEAAKPSPPPVLLRSLRNAVLTLQFNAPRRKNAWGKDLITSMLEALKEAADDPAVKVVVLTGSGDYYSSGVDFVSSFPLLPPSQLVVALKDSNQRLFDAFILFPKPILVAANGPLIGASVTSATLCDAIIASESATFSTPFAALGIVPEGCSSYWFEKVMGEAAARRMLGEEGWKPTAAEAHATGMVLEVIPEGGEEVGAYAAQTDTSDFRSSSSSSSNGSSTREAASAIIDPGRAVRRRAQELAEEWIAAGKVRSVAAKAEVETLLAVNARESEALARAFVSERFLRAMHGAAKAKGKTKLAAVFWLLLHTQWAWSRL